MEFYIQITFYIIPDISYLEKYLILVIFVFILEHIWVSSFPV